MRKKINITAILSLIALVATAVCYALTSDRSHSWMVVYLLAGAAVTQCAHIALSRIPWLEYLPFIFTLGASGLFVKLAIDEAYGIMSKANVAGLSTLWLVSAALLAVSVVLTAATTIFVRTSSQHSESVPEVTA
ncbi:hypothetical protein [Alloscardovia omnicolens]|uniref:hypothetical protein n=1 Tax=Alloscardovia omnicolens TaxID=419015 RepID=UPI003A676360